jgi:tetratricopeptide (TPR) repeat protein
VSPRPPIFISAVSRELHSARQLVANTLTFLGYQPVWQDIFGTEGGDLRGVLREKIDHCQGLVQLVGHCYGADPPTPDEQFGRVSYTQYEALYARKRGKKVWYLFIDETFPSDAHEPEPEELRELQAAYRGRLQSDTHIFHPLTSHEALEAGVLKLRDDLTRLRRGVKRWAVGVTALLLLVAVASLWLIQTQRRQGVAIQKQGEQVTTIVDRYQKMQEALVRLAEAEAKSKEPGSKLSPEEQRARAYVVLEKDLGLPAGALAKELPGFALELYTRSDTTPLMRARAAYALNKFDEAEKLSLDGAEEDRKAYETATRVAEDRRKSALEAYELAGWSAQKRIQYAAALGYVRKAEKLTDRARDSLEWARVQFALACFLDDEGQHYESERILRDVFKEREQKLGAEHPDALSARHLLANELVWQGKYAQGEAEYRDLLKVYERRFGLENPDTLRTRQNLAVALSWQGKYAEASEQFRRVNKIQEKLLGPEHPDTLNCRLRLANNLCSQGKYAEAEAQYRDLLRLDQKVFGPENPETISSGNNIGVALALEGKYAEAEAQYREVLKLKEKVLGSEHPSTLNTRFNIADVLMTQGNHIEAEAQAREVLKLREKVLGPAHPDTLDTRNTIAEALAGQHKYAVAEAENRAVLKLREKVLGPEHPDTLESCYNLAAGLGRQGKTQEAKEFAQRAAEGARKVLGPEHPSTKKYEKLLQELEQDSTPALDR